jgi:O-antigen/teichoic acid export membrane protein
MVSFPSLGAAADEGSADPKSRAWPMPAARVARARNLCQMGSTIAALLDQGVISGGNFLMIVLVSRATSAHDLGSYTLLMGLLLLAAAVQDAAISTTFLVRKPELGPADQAGCAGAFLLMSCAFSACCAAAACAAWAWFEPTAPGRPAVGAAILAFLVPAFLLREHLRRYEFAYLRMNSALLLDAVAITIQFGLVGWFLLKGELSLPACLLAVAIGNGSAVLLGAFRRRNSFALPRLRAAISDVVSLSGWVLLALALFVVTLQVMPWLVAARLGLEAAGVYGACMALAGLGNPLLTGIINTMMPIAAAAFSAKGAPAVLDALRRDAILLALVTGFIALITIAAASDLLTLVFGSRYAAHAPLLAILAIAFFVRSIGVGAYVGCWALQHAKWNAVANAGALAVGVAGALFLIPWLGVLGAGLGLLGGDAFGAATRWLAFLWLGGKILDVHRRAR